MQRTVTSRPVPGRDGPAYRWAVLAYDRVYRYLHRLDSPASEVGSVLRIEVRRARRARRLPDGAVVDRGDRIGVLHLNNARIGHLHASEPSLLSAGLEFRRQFMASLHALAAQARAGGPLADVRAFEATTILHLPLRRLGFQPEPGGGAWGRLVAVYQRALLASLHPRARLGRPGYQRARRLWCSREALLARFGDGRAAAARRWAVPPAA